MQRGVKATRLINRLHFPVTLLSPQLQTLFRLITRTTPLLPGITKKMEELEIESVPAAEGRIPMTSVVYKVVGYLEDYAKRILPANLY